MTLLYVILALVVIDALLYVPDAKALPEAREVRR